MANNQNLRPITSVIQAREMGGKGGSVCSERKRFAKKLYWLKRKGLSNETCRTLYNIMTDREYAIFDVLLFIKRMERECNNPYQKIQLINTYLQWIKIHYGEKIQTENLNINVDATANEIIQRLKEYDRREYANKHKQDNQ